MSRTLVKRISRVMDRHASRRGFLRSSAMTATAMAVAPVAYTMRPITAQSAIITCRGNRCSPDSLCCDAWTEFCCRITGENACPPGTIVAGWWKVDDSDFCSIEEPRPRYYLDCNLECDPACACNHTGMCKSSCTKAVCRCVDGCDTRQSECKQFRYGQCNQDTCVGAISCRVVTCVPPWKWDGACSATPTLTNEMTRWHDRSCLHEGFNDVPPRAYYAEAVQWATAAGIIDGLSSKAGQRDASQTQISRTWDLFGPDRSVSRAEFAVFLWRYQGEPTPVMRHPFRSMPASVPFQDVPVGSYYEQAVKWVAGRGILADSPPQQFDPEADVTIAHAILSLHQLAGSPIGLSAASLAADDSEAWYADALRWALHSDLVWWYPEAPFGPDRLATRAEIAMLIHRFHTAHDEKP